MIVWPSLEMEIVFQFCANEVSFGVKVEPELVDTHTYPPGFATTTVEPVGVIAISTVSSAPQKLRVAQYVRELTTACPFPIQTPMTENVEPKFVLRYVGPAAKCTITMEPSAEQTTRLMVYWPKEPCDGKTVCELEAAMTVHVCP
jgi:hypothetical protein